MADLLAQLAADVYRGFKDTVAYEVILRRQIELEDGSGGFTTTETLVTGKGFVVDYKDEYKMRGLVESGDRRVVILQQSMVGTIPKVHDQVTARGETFDIIGVGEDPAEALWELQGRP